MVNVCVIGSSLRVLSKVNFLRVSRYIGAVIWDMEVVSVRLFKLYYCYNASAKIGEHVTLSRMIQHQIEALAVCFAHTSFAYYNFKIHKSQIPIHKNSVSENKLHPQESRR